MLKKFTSFNLPKMVHESTARFIDHHTYYEYKITIWHDLDLNKMKASYKFDGDYLSIRFMPPETNKSLKSITDIEVPDGWITK
jgi:hypothetical protein